MPSHKNQHFVPKCHLKPFSLNRDGAAINLFSIRRKRAVENAPVKGQCARNYLYGADLKLETALQFFEGEYARVVRVIQDAAEDPSQQDLDRLRDFAFLQYQRTFTAIERAQMSVQEMENEIYEGSPEKPPNVSAIESMRLSMRMFAQLREAIVDLKACIITNETVTDFVTSDDPAFFASKFHAQRLGTNNFGIGSSGALFFLPLTPRALLMCYDGGVYTTPEKQGCFVTISDPADVLALNELQYLKASEAIYFSKWSDRDRIAQEFGVVEPRRPKSWSRVFSFVAAGSSEHFEHFRRATEEERKAAKHRMVGLSSFHPTPSRWISKLKYRDPLQAYSNGSAAGYVRRAEWLRRGLHRSR